MSFGHDHAVGIDHVAVGDEAVEVDAGHEGGGTQRELTFAAVAQAVAGKLSAGKIVDADLSFPHVFA